MIITSLSITSLCGRWGCCWGRLPWPLSKLSIITALIYEWWSAKWWYLYRSKDWCSAQIQCFFSDPMIAVQPSMIFYFQRWYCRCLLSQPGDDDQREWRHLYHCHQDNCQDHGGQVQVRILFWFLSHLRPSIAWPYLCCLTIVETGWMWLWLLKMTMRNLLTLLKLLVLVLRKALTLGWWNGQLFTVCNLAQG